MDSWRDRHPESRAEHRAADDSPASAKAGAAGTGRTGAARVIVVLQAVVVLLARPQTVLSAIARVARNVAERVMDILRPAPSPIQPAPSRPTSPEPPVGAPAPTPSAAPMPTTPRRVPSGAGELARLELEAWDRLDRLGVTLSEQVSFTRDADRARVDILVDTATRKAAIVAALASLEVSSFLSSRVRTFDEVRTSRRTSTAGRVTARDFGIIEGRPAGHDRLVAHLARTGAPASPTAADGMADHLVTAAGRMRREAWLLKRIVDRFPPAERLRFDYETDDCWRRLMLRHLDPSRRSR